MFNFVEKFISRVLKNRILLICFILFASVKGFTQESWQAVLPIEYSIKSTDYTAGSNERQMLNALSINNLKNIYQLRIHIRAALLLNVQRDEQGHLYAYLKVVQNKITGDTYFRDFLIDTLLMPRVFDGKLTIMKNGVLISEMPIEMLLTGGVLDLESIEKYASNTEELTFKVVLEKFYYSDQQLWEFMNKANLINTYYSYNEALKLILEQYVGSQISGSNPSSETFIAWHHIHRVNSFIENYRFATDLNLDNYDPLGFLDKWKESQKLESRASTLFYREFEKGKRGKLLDRNIYGQKYVGISRNYIALSKRHQPNMVAAFNELVRINPEREDLIRMTNVASFYDVFKITGIPSTSQLIYNNFISEADSVLKKQEYLNALHLVRNAGEMASFFTDLKHTKQYTEVYTMALNGLMNSFLKVSVMAYKARNFKIAKRYYQEAQQIYDDNAALIGDDYSAKNSFKDFIEKQVDLAEILLNDRYFEEAISLLDQAYSIGEQNSIELDSVDFNTAYQKGYSGIYQMLVDSVEYYIKHEDSKNSLSALLGSAAFEQSHNAYLKRDERISSYAYVLFNSYLELGLSELQSATPENAINFLLEARSLNNTFELNEEQQIDSALNKAIVPIILQTIQKASFEVWANKIDEAGRLKDDALHLAKSYGISNNDEIDQAILLLENKMANRACVDLQYKTANACKILVNRVQSGKFDEARLVFELAKLHVDEQPDCVINTTEMDSLALLYQPLFSFVDSLDLLYDDIETKAFQIIKSRHDKIKADFIANKLRTYTIEMPELQVLLKEEGNVSIFNEAIQYYISQNEYQNAFYYLNLLRIHQFDSKETKEFQKIIGRNLCNNMVDKVEFIETLTKNDAWFKTLRASCIKN